MVMTNKAIYETVLQLNETFADKDMRLPVKVNFFLQKNIKTLLALYDEIENARLEIAKAYGTLNSNGTAYDIPVESNETVSKELNDLLAIEQDVPLKTISYTDLGPTNLSIAQMQALMFMMEEE